MSTSLYIFSVISAIGFSTQWVTMLINGSYMSMSMAPIHAALPSGTPLKTTWTGIFPVDYMLTSLAAFFAPIIDLRELPDMGPYLMLVDLLFVLGVFNLISVVENQRHNNKGWMRYLTWQPLLWNYCGAGTTVPLFSYFLLKNRTTIPIPLYRAQALPFTALWGLITSIPILLPGMLGIPPFQVQTSVIIWSLAPLTLGPIQGLASRTFTNRRINGGAAHVTAAFWVAGSFSALIHIAVAFWAYLSPELSLARIYIPNHSAARPGANLLAEGAMLFIQYGYLSVFASVLVLGAYVFRIRPSRPTTWKTLLLFVIGMLITGPGAGLAWLMSTEEAKLFKVQRE